MSDNITVTFNPGDDAEPQQAVVPRRLGHVTLVSEIGQGGMGVVWRGHDELLRRDVAVKLFRDLRLARDPLLRRQFIEGSRAAAGVKHPNVVSVYHADECEDLLYIVMELVLGHTLRDILTRYQRLEPRLSALVIAKVLDALTAIHAAQVVHRDIKPSNVLFDDRGELLVSDFGLSYHREYSSTGDEGVLGTPPYMAPEMFEGDASYQSDVYAAGIMFYELLCGERPYRANSVAEYEVLHQGTVPDEPLHTLGLAEDVLDIVRRATNPRKIFRYKTAQHMLKAVTDAHAGLLSDRQAARRLREIMLDSKAATRDPGSGHEDRSPTPEATYFDLLSRRAEAKRRRKGDD